LRRFRRVPERRATVRFDLYDYRRDVSKGTVHMGADGSLNVDLAARK
jgi:hypothetical protein